MASRTTALDRLVSEAPAIEAEAARDAGAIGFVCRALTQATLPHRKVEGSHFERRNGNFTLTLLAPPKVGLPYPHRRTIGVDCATEGRPGGSEEPAGACCAARQTQVAWVAPEAL